MRQLLVFLFITFSSSLFAQQNLKGIVLNEHGEPIEFATAALLKVEDSTLVNFGIANETGDFEIKYVAAGKYIFQLSFVGYTTYDTIITVPALSKDPAIFILQPKNELLNTVEIKSERIPLAMKGDTIEYNAGAYKTQADASAEDLLKKLPGVQVDQSGNIKAQGEDVQQVLVDGKEFFSSDPTVATKNLPADAIDKVQVYDKSTDEAEFTGIDDGTRNKTINLLLKDDKKSMWLGDVKAGGGTDNTYQSNAKAYRFTKTNQFAMMGMLNNINQFGFSIHDYIDFNGGVGAMMHNGGFRIETGSSDEMPVNFGQNVDGLITSGAGGMNFTHEPKPGNRFNVSYLGNGYEKDLLQNTFTENFIPAAIGNYAFHTNEDVNEITTNYYHRMNFNFRNKPDSMQSIFANGAASLSHGNQNSKIFTETFSADSLINSLTSNTYDKSHSVRGNADLSYIHKTGSDWKYIKANVSASAKSSLSETQWNNLTQYFDTGLKMQDDAYQNNTNYQIDYSATLSGSLKLNRKFYLDPSLSAGGTKEVLNRAQGNLLTEDILIDSLSPDFLRKNVWMKPGLSLKYSTKKTHYKLTLAAQDILLQNTLNEIPSKNKNYVYLTPQFTFEKDIKQGRHIRFLYESEVNAPTATQLLPVTNYINPLSVYTGNAELKPEYSHNIEFNWMLFDEFSFTSLFTHVQAGYTKDKINFSKTINPDLSQSLTLMNVASDYTASAGAEFSTPIRPLKINVNLSLEENYNRGINYVNEIENTIDAFTHNVQLSFDNRSKDKLDARAGASLKYTQAHYSIETNSSNYFTNTLFLEMDYTPFDKWRFSFDADVDRYTVEGFEASTIVPLLQAEITRFIFKSNRGSISLRGYDLLNKNTNITQMSAYNYVQQQQSNTIARYFMLSFNYRINKSAVNNDVDVEVNGR
ncbi:MAG: TonB-dependent receptor [Chitinophagales bacterium]|nr:TonB-dependent receptor [Chitinophagales bacterium]